MKSSQHSALGTQHSAFSTQHSALSIQQMRAACRLGDPTRAYAERNRSVRSLSRPLSACEFGMTTMLNFADC